MWSWWRRRELDDLRARVAWYERHIDELTRRLNQVETERAFLLRHVTGLPEWPVPEWVVRPPAAEAPAAPAPSPRADVAAARAAREATRRPGAEDLAISFEDVGDAEARALGIEVTEAGEVVYTRGEHGI
jgi:hypothetical protein